MRQFACWESIGQKETRQLPNSIAIVSLLHYHSIIPIISLSRPPLTDFSSLHLLSSPDSSPTHFFSISSSVSDSLSRHFRHISFQLLRLLFFFLKHYSQSQTMPPHLNIQNWGKKLAKLFTKFVFAISSYFTEKEEEFTGGQPWRVQNLLPKLEEVRVHRIERIKCLSK